MPQFVQKLLNLRVTSMATSRKKSSMKELDLANVWYFDLRGFNV